MSQSINRQLQKIIRKEAKKQAAQFQPHTISLKKWCESYGVPNHFDWLRSLILNELDENEGLGKYVKIDVDLYDLHLDDDGVFIFSDTLQGFFGLEQVRAMHSYLRSRNELAKLQFCTKRSIKNFTDEQLEKYSKIWDSHDSSGTDEDIKELVNSIGDLIHGEQRRRSRRLKKKNA